MSSLYADDTAGESYASDREIGPQDEDLEDVSLSSSGDDDQELLHFDFDGGYCSRPSSPGHLSLLSSGPSSPVRLPDLFPPASSSAPPSSSAPAQTSFNASLMSAFNSITASSSSPTSNSTSSFPSSLSSRVRLAVSADASDLPSSFSIVIDPPSPFHEHARGSSLTASLTSLHPLSSYHSSSSSIHHPSSSPQPFFHASSSSFSSTSSSSSSSTASLAPLLGLPLPARKSPSRIELHRVLYGHHKLSEPFNQGTAMLTGSLPDLDSPLPLSLSRGKSSVHAILARPPSVLEILETQEKDTEFQFSRTGSFPTFAPQQQQGSFDLYDDIFDVKPSSSHHQQQQPHHHHHHHHHQNQLQHQHQHQHQQYHHDSSHDGPIIHQPLSVPAMVATPILSPSSFHPLQNQAPNPHQSHQNHHVVAPFSIRSAQSSPFDLGPSASVQLSTYFSAAQDCRVPPAFLTFLHQQVQNNPIFANDLLHFLASSPRPPFSSSSPNLTDSSDGDPAATEKTRYTRQWNSEFQELISEIQDEDLERFRQLRNLANDFVSEASKYGRIIITERFLPDSQKTIKPSCTLGGIAGGEKYLHSGILFKFAIDVQVGGRNGRPQTWVYGGQEASDEAAMRAAANELRGLISVFRCHVAGINVPLMTLIDHLGFRLVAVAHLPIDRSTLIYGSYDGGVSVHASDATFNHRVKLLAQRLNLRGHLVRNVKLHLPGDIEGHRSKLGDGSFYLIDFARIFPCEAPDFESYRSSLRERRAVLYRLLRPELVKAWQVSLSSDAYTRFQQWDPHDKQMNGQVRLVTTCLFQEVIPAYADHLDTLNQTALLGLRVSEDLHHAGICVRHLGRVRCAIKRSDLARCLLLSEMVSRAAKNDLRRRLREQSSLGKLSSLEPHRAVVLGQLNAIFGRSSETFWFREVKALLRGNFIDALRDSEEDPQFDLRQSVDLKIVFDRFLDLTKIRLSHRAYQELSSGISPSFEFVDPDLDQIGVRVKHLNIVDLSAGIVCRLEAATKLGTEYSRLFDLAVENFKSSLRSITNCPQTYYQWGRLLHERALRMLDKNDFQEAASCYRRSLESNPDPTNRARVELGRLRFDQAAHTLQQLVDNAPPIDTPQDSSREPLIHHARRPRSLTLGTFPPSPLPRAMSYDTSAYAEPEPPSATTPTLLRSVPGTPLKVWSIVPDAKSDSDNTTPPSRGEQQPPPLPVTPMPRSPPVPLRSPPVPLRSPPAPPASLPTNNLPSLPAPPLFSPRIIMAPPNGGPPSLPDVATSPPSLPAPLQRSHTMAVPLSSSSPGKFAKFFTSISSSNADSLRCPPPAPPRHSLPASASSNSSSEVDIATSVFQIDDLPEQPSSPLFSSESLESFKAPTPSPVRSESPGDLPRTYLNRTDIFHPSFVESIETALGLFRDALGYCHLLYDQLIEFFVFFVTPLVSNSGGQQQGDGDDFRAEARATCAIYIYEFLVRSGTPPKNVSSLASEVLMMWARLLLARVTFSDARLPSPYGICAEIGRILERSLVLKPEQPIHTLLQTGSTKHLAVLAVMALKSFLFAGSLLAHRCATRLELDLYANCSLPIPAIVLIVSQAPQLRSLSLRGCWQIGVDDALQVLRHVNRKLHSLDLSECHKINGQIMSEVSALPLLKSLRVRNCDISGGTLSEYLCKDCSTEFEELDASCAFASSTGISDDAILGLARRCRYFLRVIFLNDCPNITDASLLALKGCQHLEQLHIRRPQNLRKSGITNKGLVPLLKYWHELKEQRMTVLDISFCRKITEKHLEMLPKISSFRQIFLVGTNHGKRLSEKSLLQFSPRCKLVM